MQEELLSLWGGVNFENDTLILPWWLQENFLLWLQPCNETQSTCFWAQQLSKFSLFVSGLAD